MGDFIFRHARACCTKYACTTPHCLYGKEKVCFLVASKPISLYAFLIHEVCMFKTDRYMLNALFLGSWSLAPWLHGPCDSWSLALGPCLLLLGSWSLALHASLHLQGSQFVLYMALGQWLLHVSQLLVLDCMQACWSLVLGPVPHLGVEISRFTPCIY